jgi:glycosyltransferase involved in cell wall biosynthesis
MAAIVRPIVRARRRRPGLVSTEHNLWESFSPITRALNGATVPLDDLTLAVSEEVRRSAWRRLQARTRVLQHGIPVEQLSARSAERESARTELEVADDAVLVATIANFREKKDYPTLLAAAEAAVATEPRLRFVSVGQGPLENQLRDLHGRTALGDRFRFLGYQADPARVLAAADVFTLTSRYEGLPVALLEALALGLPAVVSRVGGIPDVVRQDVEGTLIEPGDVAGFTAAYVLLARDEGRRQRLGRGAAARAGAFDIARTAEVLEELYRAVARR